MIKQSSKILQKIYNSNNTWIDFWYVKISFQNHGPVLISKMDLSGGFIKFQWLLVV